MPKLYRAHLDFETYSEINLTDVGSDRYSRDPSTEVLMAAYARGDDDVKHWDAQQSPMPAELEDIILDECAVKFAWNAPFEMQITQNTLKMPVTIEHWRDTMVMAMSCSLPGSLGKAGEVVGLADDKKKDARGKALIRKFSMPRKPTKSNPNTRLYWYDSWEEWVEFCGYNVTDVVAERAIYHKLRPFDMSKEEWRLWFLDQKINQAGIPINMEMVDNANAIYEYVKEDRINQMREITGLSNPGSTSQLLPWLQARGYQFEDCQKGHISRARDGVKNLLEQGKPLLITQYAETADDGVTAAGEVEVPAPDVADMHRVLELRLEAAKSSPTKYAALQRAVDRESGVLRNSFQFAGAQRTKRWAGRIYQPQNLAKPEKYLEKFVEEIAYHLEYMSPWAFNQVYAKPMDALAAGVRPAAQAPAGLIFADADLNAIENRVLGWLANCPKILRVFEQGRDPYVDFATYLFGGTYDELWAEYKGGNSKKRTVSKPGVLGCGYQLGPGEKRVNHKTGEVEATGLLGYAWNMGIRDFTEEQAKLSVKVFRETYSEVVDFWYGIERAAKKCILTGDRVDFGLLSFEMKSPFMLMYLPSGRPLYYCRPRIEDQETPWGATKPTITYEGLNDKNQWVRIKTHGGKLTENADQATARDLLASGITLAMEQNIDLRLHVHDQLVALVGKEGAEEQLAILQECMGVNPWWSYARKGFPDLPLDSAGFLSRVFMKD
jgi:DNA polymerase